MTDFVIRQPDDWHLHLRDGEVLKSVISATAKWCARAIIMPNLLPPITTAEMAADYQKRIMEACPQDSAFTPLMTLYLTDRTDAGDVIQAAKDGVITAVKLYPAGATTHSQSGVTDIKHVMQVLEAMADSGVPLLVHGEVTDGDIDIFDREAVFIERILDPLRMRLPTLKIVCEHITTKTAADYVLSADGNLAATVTPHHLLMNRNALFMKGLNPYYYCLPVLKRETHRLALCAAVLKDTGKVFLGSDSAPHTDAAKLQSCGCAGIFNAPNCLPCLAQFFENAQSLDKLEGFTSIYGAQFYGLPVNENKITLKRLDAPQLPVPPFDTKEGPVHVFDPQMDVFWYLDIDAK